MHGRGEGERKKARRGGGVGGGWRRKKQPRHSYFVETKIENEENGAQTIEIIFMKVPFN